MGTRGREIVGMDVDKLIGKLNAALADEWLAYYQYWVGARLAKGPMRGIVSSELNEHAGEELEHAEILVERILQLGGKPILNPKDWFEKTNCGYDTPMDPSTMSLLEQNIKGEQCAIDVYVKLMNEVKDADPITYNIIVDILEDEVQHEEDLQAIFEDIEMMKEKHICA
ncbi:MAG: ferritin [Candidatus Eremiobacteraeota bacterium]|nr:ferritin [Candidatus Eremiobacteraeota bacterium]